MHRALLALGLAFVGMRRAATGYVDVMARDTPVRDVMTTDVVTLRAEMPLEDAAGLLAEHGISGAPVVDAHERLIGMLDDTDLLTSTARLHAPTTLHLLGAYLTLPGEQRRFSEELRHALAQTVEGVMRTEQIALPLDATCEDAASVMVEQGVSRVTIVNDDGSIAGIVTRGDLVRAMTFDG